MRSRIATGLSLGILLALSADVLMADSPINDQRKAELRHLLKQDCGSCHGMTLKGGLGPAITAEALADQSRPTVTSIILYGRPGTAMPPWSSLLTEEEAEWLADALLDKDQP